MNPRQAAHLGLTAVKVDALHDLLGGRRLPPTFTRSQRGTLHRLAKCGHFRTDGNGSDRKLLLHLANPNAALSAAAQPVREVEVVPHDDGDRIAALVLGLWRDPAAGGYRGARTIHRLLAQRYAGIALRNVDAALQTQATWQRTVPRPPRVAAPLRPTRIGHVAMDLFFVQRRYGVGYDPVLPGSAANQPILLAIDVFSKYLWGAVLPCKGAGAVADALESFWLADGPPWRLQSDRGREFNNDTVAALCGRFGVDQRLCRAYHSACNGAAERAVAET